MLSLFRTNQLVANALLIFYILLLRFSSFVVPYELHPGQGGILGENLLSIVPPEGTLSAVLSIILIFLQALLINITAARYRVARSVSLFPGVFYVLLCSSFPDFLYLSPVLVANTFLILALYELLGVYKKYYSNGRIFNAGLWIGLATLFYFSSIVFIGAIFIGFFILRAFKIKEQIGLLLGFISPFWLVGIYYFVQNALPDFWSRSFGNIGFLDANLSNEWDSYVQLSIFAIFILAAIFSYRTYTYKVSIQAQKFVDVFFWVLAFSATTLLIQDNIQADHLIFLAVPLSFLIGMTFLYMNRRLAEALHFLLLAGIFLLQFKPFWYIGG